MLRRRRSGFTLVEMVIAMFIFAVGGLGLAASAASVTKQVAATTLRFRALNIARSRSEMATGSECGTVAAGSSTENGVRSVWTVGESDATALDQRLERTDFLGVHTDRFMSAVPCD